LTVEYKLTKKATYCHTRRPPSSKKHPVAATVTKIGQLLIEILQLVTNNISRVYIRGEQSFSAWGCTNRRK